MAVQQGRSKRGCEGVLCVPYVEPLSDARTPLADFFSILLKELGTLKSSNGRSKGEVESAIRNAIIKFEQEFMGRGPADVRAFIIRDNILVRLKGVLTPAERQLAKNDDGIRMVKQMRQNLIALGGEELRKKLHEITGAQVTALYTDIDVPLDERIIAFTLDHDLEAGSGSVKKEG